MPFIFHAGESLNYTSNTNVYDALLLGSVRVGHGINLAYHSDLLEKYKEKKICVEVCPVSN